MRFLQSLPIILVTLLVVAAGVLIASQVFGSSAPPNGPADVIWDHETCAHCGMHIGEPGFAAQLQTQDGRIFNFDDPGCAVRFMQAHQPAIHALYYHHQSDDRWLSADHAAFVRVAQSPMGSGFAAVDAGTPGSQPIAAVRAQIAGETPR